MKKRLFLLKLITFSVLSFYLFPFTTAAQSQVVGDTITFAKAEVTQVNNEETKVLPGLDVSSKTQMLTARIIDGAEAGKEVTFENDYVQLQKGDTFYLRHTLNSLESLDQYSVADYYRLDIVYVLLGLFVFLIFVFGGIQGIRGLASLTGSLVLIFYLLLPGILHGYSPLFVSLGVASLVILVGSYITHGINKTTTAAVLGMVGTVAIAALLAHYFVYASHLSGYTSEEVTYVNLNSRGAIDLVGLLFGGILIGLLGVLYDIAIGQAVAVEELQSAGTHLKPFEIYKKAIRIGREHIGALVNTLAIAYVGASLPLLLLVSSSSQSFSYILNSEIFATEIIRTLIGSIGLILAVPITTFIAVYLLKAKKET